MSHVIKTKQSKMQGRTRAFSPDAAGRGWANSSDQRVNILRPAGLPTRLLHSLLLSLVLL